VRTSRPTHEKVICYFSSSEEMVKLELASSTNADRLEWQEIDWTYIPTASIVAVRQKTHTQVSYGLNYQAPPPESWTKDDVLTHPGMSDDDLLDLYRDSGFDTDLILQNPFTHSGPSAACVIGFPVSLPKESDFRELKKFRRWVCRIHVDIRRDDNGELFSIPHVEVDPAFHPMVHLEFQGREVYGGTALGILRMLLT